MSKRNTALLALTLFVLVGAAQAQVLKQVTDSPISEVVYRPSITADGSAVWQITTGNPFGQNPRHARQIEIRDTGNGSGTPYLSLPEGVIAVSVSDDGTQVAFVSYADAAGGNHDESLEVFLGASNGTGIVQLTDFSSPPYGEIDTVHLSGSGNRVLFVGDVDPLATNPDTRPHLFVVDADGSNLRQLAAMPTFGSLISSISDDGTRIVFASDEDLTGQNPDEDLEIFAIEHDGSNLRQLTNSATFESMDPAISGDGSTIVFTSTDDLTGGNPTNARQIYAMSWDGSNLRQVFSDDEFRYEPTISDDAQTLAFLGGRLDPVENPDGVLQVWTSEIDGSGETTLTAAPAGSQYGYDWVTLSGDGSQAAWIQRQGDLGNNPDEGAELYSVSTSAGPVAQLTELPLLPDVCEDRTPGGGAITPDGSRIVYPCNGNIFRIQADGTDRFQLTTVGGTGVGTARAPDISADGQTVVYGVRGSGAVDNNVYAVDADGSNRRRLNPDPFPGNDNQSIHPIISDDGSKVVFQACFGFPGFPISLGCDLWSIDPDGSNLTKMTSLITGDFLLPRIDASGTWATFAEGGDVFRVRIDGTSTQTVLAGASFDPDIDATGNRIVFLSQADPLGTNADGNSEIFLRDYGAGGLVTQLTDTTDTRQANPRISRDGNFVTFSSLTSFFDPLPEFRSDGYRLEIATGRLERVGGLRRGSSSLGGSGSFETRRAMDIDQTGRRVLYGESGDYAELNGDFRGEFWIADFGTAPQVTVGKAAPTVFSWEPTPSAIRYDAIRGSVADLAASGGNVDLGSVVCLEDESPDPDTEGFGDGEPPVGTAYFYLFRGTQGAGDGPGSYGTASDGSERVASGGDCNP